MQIRGTSTIQHEFNEPITVTSIACVVMRALGVRSCPQDEYHDIMSHVLDTRAAALKQGAARFHAAGDRSGSALVRGRGL